MVLWRQVSWKYNLFKHSYILCDCKLCLDTWEKHSSKHCLVVRLYSLMLVAEPSQDQSQLTSAPEVELHNESTFSDGGLGILVWVWLTLGTSKDVVNCPRKAVKATMLIDTDVSTSPSCLCNKLGILQYYVVWSTLCSSWVGDQSETKSFKSWISN